MFEAKKLRICLIIVFASNILVQGELTYTYDFISVDIINKTPEKVIVHANITRISRGVFTLNGLIDIKENLTDELHGGLKVYYSLYGSNFITSPYHVTDVNLSNGINNYYKEYIMEAALECTENAPVIVDKFVPPLTKRVIQINNCPSANDDLPPIMNSGYYKLIFAYKGQAEGSAEFLIKVEPN